MLLRIVSRVVIVVFVLLAFLTTYAYKAAVWLDPKGVKHFWIGVTKGMEHVGLSPQQFMRKFLKKIDYGVVDAGQRCQLCKQHVPPETP